MNSILVEGMIVRSLQSVLRLPVAVSHKTMTSSRSEDVAGTGIDRNAEVNSEARGLHIPEELISAAWSEALPHND